MTIIPGSLFRVPGERGVYNRLSYAVPGGGSPYGSLVGSSAAEFGSIYGQTIPTGYGTRPVFGAVIWAGPIRTYDENGVTKRRVSFAMSFGMGSGASGLKARILKLEADGTVLLDRTEGVRFRKAGVNISLYPGDNDQLPDPTIEEVEGVGNVPGFRGHIYAVFRDFPLSDFGFTKIPKIRVLLNEFAADFNKWWQFTRIPYALNGDIPTGVHASLCDWQRRLYMSVANDVSIVTDIEKEAVSLRVFDMDAKAEVAHNTIFDRHEPFGGNDAQWAARPPSQAVYVVPHSSLGGEPFYDPQTFSGEALAPNIIDNFAGYVDEFSGLVFLPASASIPNSQHYIWVEPLSGRVVNKISEMDTLGFAASMRSPDVTRRLGFATQEEDLGNRAFLVISQLWGTCKLYHFNGEYLKRRGQIGRDSLNFRPWGDYENVPGTGAIVGLVPNEFVSGSDYNYYYVARGSKIWRLYVNVFRMGAEGHQITQSSFWEIVADFTSVGTIKRLVMDKPAKELFVLLDDGALSHVAKMKTYRTPVERFVFSGTAQSNVIEEDILWVKALPFRCHYSIFPVQHNDQDYSLGYFVTRIDPGYKGALLAAIDMASGGFELMTYSYLSAIDQDDASSHFVDYNQRIVFDVQEGRLLQTEVPAWVSFDFAAGDGKVELSGFLQWAGESAGFDAADITITNVTNLIWGSYIDRTTDFEPLLDDVSSVYGLDWVQSEGKLKIVGAATGGTGATVRAALTKADLAPIGEGEDGNTNLRTLHTDPATLPERLSVSFIDKALDYAPNTIEVHRSHFPVPTTKGEASVSYSIPIIDDSGTIFPLAYQALYRLQAESVAHEFRLSQRNYLLEPVDVITIDMGSRLYKMKLREVTRNGDWSLSCSAISYSVEERPTITVDPFEIVTHPLEPHRISFSQTLFFDLPALFDPETEARAVDGYATFRTATLSRGQAGWLGARVTINETTSTNAAAPFYTADEQPKWGKLISSLPAVSYPTIDHATTLRVRLYNGAFAAFTDITADELLGGALNTALVGSGDEWELLSWQNIADEGEGVIALTNLHRCQHATELAGMRRGAGDFFIPLQAATRWHSVDIEKLGATFIFKARGIDELATEGYATLGTVTSGPDRPLAVVNLHAVRDVGTGDVLITWSRRDRVAEWDWLDGSEPTLPNAEAGEAYDLEVYDSDGVLVRTESAFITPSFNYLAADQTTDGLSLTAPQITVQVWQMSATVGRGWSKRYTLDVE